MAVQPRAQDPDLLIGALNALGFTLSHMGELELANSYLDRAIGLSDPVPRQPYPPYLYLLDPRIACRCQSAINYCLLGYPDTALARANEAISAAQQVGHNETVGLSFIYAGWVHQLRREREATKDRSAAALVLANEHQLPQILLWGTMLNSWAVSTGPQATEAIARMRAILAMQRQAGAEVSRTYFTGLLASALLDTGRYEEASHVLTRRSRT